ncbi:DUF3667 domain-containing protein [Flavobacterium sp. 25HG05S-40]|uniref:DUF3667 domain-containing protein n=1 Tax=Flavobacterium sp. 25HG05S-40 TaxID=3458682 RepID=UPI00404401E1
MSRSPLRKDKTCLNCRYVVENRFCPNCGQENTDTRKTFHHLFVHFFEDLTHYENSFWKTIRNLLVKPAALTKEYLSGKRLSYLAPVRLYIFISFVTFFVISVWPNDENEIDNIVDMNQTQTVKVVGKDGKVRDSVISAKKIKASEVLAKYQKEMEDQKVSNEKQNEGFFNMGYLNVRQLDSMQKYGPKDEKLSDWEYNMIKKTLVIKAKYTRKELMEKFFEQAKKNFPKTLFIYMPLFAFILWLFHGKKRWYYFDHGIFTLHYFSFLLLITLILFFVRKLMNCFEDNGLISFLDGVIKFGGYAWMFYYFFPAHHRFYGESRAISLLKSIAIFFINLILMLFVAVALMLYSIISIQ